MSGTRWTNTEIDAALAELGETLAPAPQELSAMYASVREIAVAQFGVGVLAHPFGVPVVVHTTRQVARGMLSYLRPLLQPATVLAAVVLVLLGTVALVSGSRRGSRAGQIAGAPRTSSAVAALPAQPFGEGSGIAVSVFGGAVALAPTAAPRTAPVATPVRKPKVGARGSQAEINPVPGVFSQWGTSVFSEDEMLTHDRDGKYVFSS